MDIEEAGATHGVLLQGVVHTLVLLLKHAAVMGQGSQDRVTVCSCVVSEGFLKGSVRIIDVIGIGFYRHSA